MQEATLRRDLRPLFPSSSGPTCADDGRSAAYSDNEHDYRQAQRRRIVFSAGDCKCCDRPSCAAAACACGAS